MTRRKFYFHLYTNLLQIKQKLQLLKLTSEIKFVRPKTIIGLKIKIRLRVEETIKKKKKKETNSQR